MNQPQSEIEEALHRRRIALMHEEDRRHTRQLRILAVIVIAAVLLTLAILAKAGGVW